MSDRTSPKRIVGWREWVALPELGIPAIEAKLDTGARTSAIQAHDMRLFRYRGEQWVRFRVYPLQRTKTPEIMCRARVADERIVTDSGGHQEKRIVIHTNLLAGRICRPIEIGIADRETMRFRMLLGRTAIVGRFTVDPDASYTLGRHLRHSYEQPGRQANLISGAS